MLRDPRYAEASVLVIYHRAAAPTAVAHLPCPCGEPRLLGSTSRARTCRREAPNGPMPRPCPRCSSRDRRTWCDSACAAFKTPPFAPTTQPPAVRLTALSGRRRTPVSAFFSPVEHEVGAASSLGRMWRTRSTSITLKRADRALWCSVGGCCLPAWRGC